PAAGDLAAGRALELARRDVPGVARALLVARVVAPELAVAAAASGAAAAARGARLEHADEVAALKAARGGALGRGAALLLDAVDEALTRVAREQADEVPQVGPARRSGVDEGRLALVHREAGLAVRFPLAERVEETAHGGRGHACRDALQAAEGVARRA